MSRFERLAKESGWYEAEHIRPHILNRWPFFSLKRNGIAYHIARRLLAAEAAKRLPNPDRVLLAPCGTGNDLAYFWPDAEYFGIDISPIAVKNVPNGAVGDLLHMHFASKSFDAVISTLFFHHVSQEGYAPYLKELSRVLHPGGILVTMEPSALHPVCRLSMVGKKIFGNITGLVEHEHPIDMRPFERECLANGFSRAESFACSFGHNRTPTPVTHCLNVLRPIHALRHYAWMVGVIATV